MNKKLLLILTLGILALTQTANAYWRGGRGWGGWGYSRGAVGAGIAVGGATNIIGAAVTADAIKKSSPGYWEYRAEKEQREADARAERRGYRDSDRYYDRGYRGYNY